MAALFFDSSSLIKRYITETGTNCSVRPQPTIFLLPILRELKSHPLLHAAFEAEASPEQLQRNQ